MPVVFSGRAVRSSDAKTGAWRLHMRFMMLVQLPIEPFNTAVKDGTESAKMKKILEAI